MRHKKEHSKLTSPPFVKW